MQQTLGTHIRQLRRQKNMTQAELGGDLYSKSYVSALERGNLVPSRKAFLFFAEQLGQPAASLEPLFQQAEQTKQPALSNGDALSFLLGDTTHSDAPSLFNLVLRATKPDIFSSAQAFASLSDEFTLLSPIATQTRYVFLKGLLAQEQGDFPHALTYLEFALALASDVSRPIILDALGMNYYSVQQYHVALQYHLRALHLLDEDTSAVTASDLLLLVELHCAEGYRVLGRYHEALVYYKRARQHLSATHNMKLAAQLYQGLGYATYAALFQHPGRESMEQTPPTAEVQERDFQQAISFLIQCRSLYQASHDLPGESTARLSQAMVLLNFIVFKQEQAQQKADTTGAPIFINAASLFEDARQQCHQVLITWLEVLSEITPPSVEVSSILYSALAYLIRAHVREATSARLNGYNDTAERERSLASTLCEQLLVTCTRQAFPLALIREVITPSMSNPTSNASTLPRLPNPSPVGEVTAPDQLSFFNIYFAAGEAAEELGRSATTCDFAHACYTRADLCFRAAFDVLRHLPTSGPHDFGLIPRAYLRYTHLLEQRVLLMPEMNEMVTPLLAALLSELLAWMPYPASDFADSFN